MLDTIITIVTWAGVAWLLVGAVLAALSYRDLPGGKWSGALLVLFLWPLALVPWQRWGS